VGVHPSDDRSPLLWLLTGGGDGGIALALRSSTRAIPLMMLGLALSGAALIDAAQPLQLGRFGPLRFGRPLAADRAMMVAIIGLAVVNLPSLWTGAFVDPALERDQDAPDAWIDAAADLDAASGDGRVLQLPGADPGGHRRAGLAGSGRPTARRRHDLAHQ
jgi:arabinofuranan 3-O-arabinosyltransferase